MDPYPADYIATQPRTCALCGHDIDGEDSQEHGGGRSRAHVACAEYDEYERVARLPAVKPYRIFKIEGSR